MQHRIDALLNFIASELTGDEKDAVVMISDYNIERVSKQENKSPDELKEMIYKTYSDFGFDHSKGVMDMLFND